MLPDPQPAVRHQELQEILSMWDQGAKKKKKKKAYEDGNVSDAQSERSSSAEIDFTPGVRKRIMTIYLSVGSFLEMSFSSVCELQTAVHRLNGILIH